MDKPHEITVNIEGLTTITNNEYRELIACQTMLDMILESAQKDSTGIGYPNANLVEMAINQRKLYLKMLTIDSPESEALT